jgi:hypothetical protein
VVIEWRSANGDYARVSQLAADLVHGKVDVIVVGSTVAAQAVQRATSTIPIVMAAVADPVGSGLVASLAHPGGNVTGLAPMTVELSAKRLQLLKEAIPRLTRVAVLWNPDHPAHPRAVEELKAMVAEKNATLIIFDDELSPSQGKNIEDIVGTRVVDRAELILDIFATRARSSEAKMQVELAQLEYTLPRLTRMWTHLEKFRGGIGVRGPGETQLVSP